ncbi:fused MFS/spermidine synthase [Actinomyces sp. B33]|uniref:spermidine synthase n=1 Tax=Actinomyces sp. B33 TaxID=2942131 RepID=UPI00233FC118|nr:fused MFS/spermidine synthase [Actinomyces sp. B33]MDC4233071.1 fused MFS/spermidine synthase [Actinomyces sp. B33]
MARASGRGSHRFPVDSGEAEIRWEGARATLLLNGVESSCLDADHPEVLEFEYMQHLTCALDTARPAPAPVRALHIGAAACAVATAWARTRPGSRQSAVEIDAALAAVVRDHFPIPRSPEVRIRVGEGREVLDSTRPSSLDVIVRDAFADGRVPDQLRTVEAASSARRALRPAGLYLLNCAHGGGADARVDLAAVLEEFDIVASIQDPKVGRSGRRGNVVVVAQAPADGADPIDMDDLDRALRRLPLPARATRGADLIAWIAGARPLTDESIGRGPAGD